MKALFRPHPGDDWQDCEILGTDGLNYIVREVGKVWPGVAITPHVRVPAGEIFEPEILRRKYLPAGIDRWGKYRTIREVLGREAALAALGEQTAPAP